LGRGLTKVEKHFHRPYLLFSAVGPDLFWNPPILLFKGHCGFSPGGKAAGTGIWTLTSI